MHFKNISKIDTSLPRITQKRKRRETQLNKTRHEKDGIEARITLIAKPDKDTVRKENNRPISLLKSDVKKLLTKH